MAAPMEARLAVAQISKLLSCTRVLPSCHLLQARQMSFMNKLKFLQARDKKEKMVKNKSVDDENEGMEDDMKKKKNKALMKAKSNHSLDMMDQTQITRHRKRISIEEVRSYKPRPNVTDIVHMLAVECFGEVGDDWRQMKLDKRYKKFDFLTSVINELDHDIPNMDLHNMNIVEDVVKYFNTEVKDCSVLEDMTKLDLPKNLHMNLEYIRFHPETDKIHEGLSAFPGNATHVTSVKFKRKYKGYDGGDPINNPEQFTGEA